MKIWGQIFFLKRRRVKQSQGMTSKVIVKVPKRQVLRVEGKKIKDALNMLIQVLGESSRIWDVFQIRLNGLHAKLFTFLLVYLFFLPYFYLDLFHFHVLGVIWVKVCSRYFVSISLIVCSLYKGMFIM